MEDGRVKEALAIFRTFRSGFSRDEQRSIQIASETLNGHGRFYKMIGIDTRYHLRLAIETIFSKYQITNKLNNANKLDLAEK